MRKIIVSSILALMLIGCGGGGSGETTSTTQDTTNTDTSTDTNSIQGTGTVQDPFVVKNGLYSFIDEAYLKVNISIGSGTCGLLVYNSYYLDLATTVYDESFSIINSSDHYESYILDESGDYIIKAVAQYNNPSDISVVGIFSPCMTDDNSLLPELGIGLNTISSESIKQLYRFDLAQNSNIEFNGIENVGFVYIFDQKLEQVYYGSFDQINTDLNAGSYYVLVAGVYYDRETIFSVNVTPY